jgi:ketosteroid isomerase-like protein
MNKRPPTIIREFFEEYAKATSAGDVAIVAGAYFDTYIEAAPAGVVGYKVDADYRRQLKVKNAALRDKLGFTSAKLTIASITEFAPGHYLVEADWTMEFERQKAQRMRSTFRISYLLRLADPGPVILAYVSHEDEEEKMKRDGVIYAGSL